MLRRARWVLLLVGLGLLTAIGYLEVKRRRCDARVEEFAEWYAAVSAEGERNLVFSRKLAQSAQPARYRWFDAAVDVRESYATVSGKWIHWEPRLGPDPIRSQVSDELVEIYGAGPARSEQRAAPGRLPAPETFALVVERSAPWGLVSGVLRGIAEAGYAKVAFRVEGTSRIAPPPRSANTELFEKVSALTPEDRAPDLNKPVPRVPVYPRCPQALELFETYSHLNPREVFERSPQEVPEAIRACGCEVDFDAAKNQVWAQLGRFIGPPLTDVELRLATSEKGGAVFEAPAGKVFGDVFPELEKVATAGHPVRVRASEAEQASDRY